MNTLPKHDWQPSRPTPQTQGLNRPMAWIGVMLLAMLVAVGLALLFNLHHRVEAWALEVLSAWLIDLCVSL